MANIKTKIDEWELLDLEDNGRLRIYVEHNTEMGNQGVPGIQVWYTVAGGTSIVNFEPLHVARWAYQARKNNQDALLLDDYSWNQRPDTYVQNYLVIGETLKARVVVKVQSSPTPTTKEYELPFQLEQ
jgi:hypothetical protein